MPQDQMYDIKLALTNPSAEDTGTRFYSCPNGHVYAIGNCGRAWTRSKCNCGEEIGGSNHTLITTNKEENLVDKTMPGYCVTEPASKVSALPTDIRLLSMHAFHLERFLVNACMYLACGYQEEKELMSDDDEKNEADVNKEIKKKDNDLLLVLSFIVYY